VAQVRAAALGAPRQLPPNLQVAAPYTVHVNRGMLVGSRRLIRHARKHSRLSCIRILAPAH
jgi:hypothetical protein